jgi:hypothetical protein
METQSLTVCATCGGAGAFRHRQLVAASGRADYNLRVLSHHRRLLAFDHWATLTVLDAVGPVHDRVPSAIERVNHMLGASIDYVHAARQGRF